jgi:hypothetical protein
VDEGSVRFAGAETHPTQSNILLLAGKLPHQFFRLMGRSTQFMSSYSANQKSDRDKLDRFFSNYLSN